LGALTAGACLLVGQGSLADDETRSLFLSLRAVRSLCAALAGAALAVGGVLMQGLFRNPLACPSVLGTTAGASLGGQIALFAHGALAAALPSWIVPEMALPLGCLLGAGAAFMILSAAVGKSAGMVSVLLTGFILSSLLTSAGAFLTSLAQDSWELGRAMVAFSLGGVSGKGMRHVLLAMPLILIGLVASWSWGRSLDLMLTGEEEAAALGLDVRAVRRWIITWTTVLTAAAVALGGGVAFVGLVVPHALRHFTGVSHRRLIPAAALGGAIYVTLCDMVARAIPAMGEIPLGVITGFIGAPVFFALLLRSRKLGEV
jgi:iron complex transport system permease protein